MAIGGGNCGKLVEPHDIPGTSGVKTVRNTAEEEITLASGGGDGGKLGDGVSGKESEDGIGVSENVVKIKKTKKKKNSGIMTCE